jgi:hypothetical protein
MCFVIFFELAAIFKTICNIMQQKKILFGMFNFNNEMETAMRKYFSILLISVFFITACAAPQQGGPSAEHGLSGAFQGLMHLILSPIQIAAGLLEGVAALPYYAGTALADINQGMVQAQAKITLDDTYEGAYGKRINQVNPSGDTGEVFRRMKHASEYFQKVLSHQGVANASSYILTSIDTAKNDGFTLFAIVYRPAKSINVIDKYDGKTVRNFTSDDRLYYEPFQFDAKGNPQDVIVDWAGIPTDQSASQKQQAVLLTLAANAVASEKRRADYWVAEKRWIDGQFSEIMKTQNQKVEQAMKI